MLRVQISINQDQIIDIHTQRIEGFKGDNFVHDYNAYKMDGKKTRIYIGHIRHKYSQGAEELARKLLVTLKGWEKT